MLGPDARAWISATTLGDPTATMAMLDEALQRLVDADETAHALIRRDTGVAIAALTALRDPATPSGARAYTYLGVASSLAIVAAPMVEHAPPPTVAITRPLLDHAVRGLQRLHALERGDRSAFEPVLSDAAFATIRARFTAAQPHLDLVRLALLHLDIAKGGDVATRALWTSAGANLDIHNLGGEDILAHTNALAAYGLDPQQARSVALLVAHHGLAGQHVRGETPTLAFTPLLASADAGLLTALAVIDYCDTAAVCDGLLNDRLVAELDALHTVLQQDALARHPQPLADRLGRLRRGRIDAGESVEQIARELATLDAPTLDRFTHALDRCQLWYCESATSRLSPLAQIKVLAAACGAAKNAKLLDDGTTWHAQLQPLVTTLGGAHRSVPYRLRVVEAALANTSVAALLDGELPRGPLGTFATTLGRDRAILLDYQGGEEADALITLLSIYETKSSAAFHTTLKALCDLYGLRKDEFDRVANEANYLETMNAARSDKERMLDWVVPGRIVEIGPGGGVVLDLLAARYSDSEIVGVDVSREVIAALESKRQRERRSWSVVHADAFSLLDLYAPGSVNTVVLCSILHEIYSYVERAGDDGSAPRRFRIESVRDMVRAAFATLAPGGRIVIRDGIAPAPGRRRIKFLVDDARQLFELYVAQFEGRPIGVTRLPDGRIELDTADAMEFLYTYTWGPASFPYEVREQYGVMRYEQYTAAMIEWLGGATHARLIEVPLAHRSYLQPGYQQGLAGKVALFDENDLPTALPDSNCLIVVEKVA